MILLEIHINNRKNTITTLIYQLNFTFSNEIHFFFLNIKKNIFNLHIKFYMYICIYIHINFYMYYSQQKISKNKNIIIQFAFYKLLIRISYKSFFIK